ncbi:MAG: VCBS repeat-containing protein [Verrucomicrobiota bacterium]|nr:VCBS repeat-containing protein [Verrucomicrobiota bacterium]
MLFLLLPLGLLAAGFTGLANRLEWREADGHRLARLTLPGQGRPGFTVLPTVALGLQFTNRVSRTALAKRSNLTNGSGVALGDADGDGLCDIYFCRLEGSNELYLNRGGWQFQLAADANGAAAVGHLTRGAAFADVNGDGALDLLLTTFRNGTICLLNDGNGNFTDATAKAGLESRASGTTLALGDVDRDGDLDLYVAHFGELALLRDGGSYSVRQVGGKPVVTGQHADRLKIINGQLIEFGEADAFYLNDGQGVFQRVPWRAGRFVQPNGQPFAEPLDFGLCVQMRDINADGFADIYVCNDFQTPDRFWFNDGTGKFREAGPEAVRSVAYASMGVDFADIDRDGHTDFFVVEMLSRDAATRLTKSSPNNPLPPAPGGLAKRLQVARNTLFWNRGDGTFAEVGRYAGVEATDWAWQPVFLDVDLDGYDDMLVTNGHLHDVNDRDAQSRFARIPRAKREQVGPLMFPPNITANVAYRNQGNFTFAEMGQAWGFNSPQMSHGIATGDLDNDGDLDLVINCLNQPPLVYRNDTIAPRVAVQLRGRAPNTHGIGARVTVAVGPMRQTQEIIAGGRYLSGDQPRRTFAMGTGGVKCSIEVAWPSGHRSFITDPQPNHLYEITESSGDPPKPALAKREPEPFFEDASRLLNYTHVENAYDDTALQPLLPRRLDRAGPGVAWLDFDHDGDDDLLIGAGAGSAVGVYQNLGDGRFSIVSSAAGLKMPGDVVSACGWVDGSGRRTWLAVVTQYESPRSKARLRTFKKGGGLASGGQSLDGIIPGPIAVADIDADGDLDVFIGGRAVTGHYPQASASVLLRNTTRSLEPAGGTLGQALGLVNGAVFSDLDADRFPELILATEWGPVRVFKNQQGVFSEITEPLGLSGLTGLWQGVATGDFDADGRTDIVATNWGLNSAMRPNVINPPRLHYNFSNSSVPTSLLLGAWDERLKRYLPTRDLLALFTGYPGLRGVFQTHRAFADAGVQTLVDHHPSPVRSVTAAVLQSMLFLNRPDGFEAKPLPPEAQLSPAFGVSVGDLDGDGFDDLFLAQNFAAFPTDADRLDAGRGLWLRGLAQASFTPVKGHEAGLAIYGDQRACALADYDADGRLDLVVTQSGGRTRLFRNNQAKPGLRVRLVGGRLNPDAIGASSRLHFGQAPDTTTGTWREWQLGSGYGSQDGLAKVLATPSPPSAIEIRWPSGKTTRTSLPAGLTEITLTPDAKIIEQKTK